MAYIPFKKLSDNEWQDIKSNLKFIAMETKTETKILTLEQVCKKLKCSRNTVKKKLTK